jgi:hypothetical protein
MGGKDPAGGYWAVSAAKAIVSCSRPIAKVTSPSRT